MLFGKKKKQKAVTEKKAAPRGAIKFKVRSMRDDLEALEHGELDPVIESAAPEVVVPQQETPVLQPEISACAFVAR